MASTPNDPSTEFPVLVDDDMPEGFDPDARGDDDEGGDRG